MSNISGIQPVEIKDDIKEDTKQPPMENRDNYEITDDRTVFTQENKLTLQFNESIFEISSGEIIGRNHQCRDCLCGIKEVSRTHAKFIYDNGKWFIEDLGSANGAFIDGKRVENSNRFMVKKGDAISFSSRAVFKVV
jgi:pSer/pThr/pTyr-binding forkhead associated (FHA) protein